MWKLPRSRPVLARKPSRRPGRYCIRLSRVLASAVSWPMSCLVRLASALENPAALAQAYLDFFAGG